MDVDSALPLDGWRSGDGSPSSERTRRPSGHRAATVKVERIGEEIVNSISIHRLSSPAHHLDDIIAILTNNDKTVRIYSLPLGKEVTTLVLPFPMNHATLSPDGRTMVAVGDVNQAYFFQREMQATPPLIHKPHNRITSAGVGWYPMSVVALHKSEAAQTQCYFTTAWNPSGTLVAVGSEGGYITVFDTAMLEDPDVLDEDAVVAVVPGSRPDIMNPHPGAIRSMVFSPAPWDLLVWAEDQGRVCVGDLRTGLKSRQILKLESKGDGVREIGYEDVEGEEVASALRDVDELEADFMQNYRRTATTQNFADEYVEARTRQRQQRAEMASMRSQLQAQRDLRELQALTQLAAGEDDPRGLTAEEQRIFESLRSARQREEARGSSGRARNITYTSADMFTERRAAQQNGDGGRPIGEILSSVQDSLPELARTSASPGPRPTSSHGPGTPSSMPSLETASNNSSQRGGASNSQWASPTANNLVRLSDGSRLPRRRASVVLSPPATDSPSTTSSTSSNNRAFDTSSRAELGGDDSTNPWRTIEDHMSLARGPLFDTTRSSRRQQQDTPSSSATPPSRTEDLDDRSLLFTLARQRDIQRDLQRARRLGPPTTSSTPPPATASGSTLGPNVSIPTHLTQSNDILLRRAQAQQAQAQLQAQNALLQQHEAEWRASSTSDVASAWERGALAQAYRHWGERGGHVGVRTAGVAVSFDGGRIWAACEEGIFEVGVKRGERMFWGALEPR